MDKLFSRVLAPDCDPEAQRTEAGLAAEEHWCDLSPDALICLDEQWRVLFFNRTADELFQAGDTLALGHPPWQCAPLLAILEELRLDDLPPGARAIRMIELGKAGFPPFEAAVSVRGKTDQRIFTVSIRDASRKHPSQEALYQLQRRQVVGALAGGIAHDFNNILTAVICHLDLALLDPDLPGKAREMLGHSLMSARRGAELNRKLLEFSRYAETHPAAAPVAKVIEESVFLLRRGSDKRIQIQFEPPPVEVWPAWVDEGQLTQVLMNLGLNACDAMPKGGELSFHVSNRRFTPGEDRAPQHPGDFVQITVRDTGYGMSREVLSRLFEPYFTTKDFGRGAGLGLSIANHVVVAHGGWMEVESEPGSGSRFHVFLPRAMATASTSAQPVLGSPGPGAALGGYETVLLVDDEKPVRDVIQTMLSFRGYQIVEACDGAEAIDRFRSAPGRFDLVLLDIQMPRMNGWDTMEKIHEMNSRVPVLLLSGGMSDPSGVDSALLQAAVVLRKPFASGELLRAVRKALDAAVPRKG